MKRFWFLIATATAISAAIFLSLPRGSGGAQSGTVVAISSGSVASAASIVVNLSASGVPSPGLGAVTVDVSFDPAIVDAVGCAADPDHVFTLRSCNPDFSFNALRFTAISATGVAGDFPLADITFQAVGESGQSSALDVSAVTFADPDGIDLPATSLDGGIEIVGSPGNSDCDLFQDAVEVACGSDPADKTSVPERIDTAGDDDGDDQFGEALPAESEGYDCDGDGWTGTAEAYIFSAANAVNDQDPCGTSGWPADLVDDLLVPNGVSISDIQDFIDPVRYMGSDVADWANQQAARRHDVMPGDPFNLGKEINILDLQVEAISEPPMLEGAQTFASTCPWAP